MDAQTTIGIILGVLVVGFIGYKVFIEDDDNGGDDGGPVDPGPGPVNPPQAKKPKSKKK